MSPDGQYWWDGTAWRPTGAPPPPAQQLPQPYGALPPGAAAPYPPVAPYPPPYGYAAPYGYAPLPPAGPTTPGQVVAIIASWLLFWPACFVIIWRRKWPRSRKWGWTAASVGYFVVALIVVGAIAAAVSGSDHSASMERSILTDGARQLSANAKIYDPNGTPTVTINDVHCVQSAGTQNYSCQGHYTVDDPSQNFHQKYFMTISGTCDSSANCQWHSDGPGAPSG